MINRIDVRRWIRDYSRQGALEALVVRDMAALVDEPFGRLYIEANSHDGIRSLAAVNLLIMMHGDEGIAAMLDLARLDGWGGLHARQALEALEDGNERGLAA